MFNQFRQRSLEPEFIDTGDYTSDEYEGCLIEMARVNRWLGDTGAVRNSLLREINLRDPESFSLLDVGAGSGELLTFIARRARQARRQTQLVGLERNARSALAIHERRKDFPEIEAVRGDAFHLPFPDDQFDYAFCSLFTHHFNDLEVVTILRELARVAARRIYVVDLFRHPIAYYFYTTIGRLFLHNRLLRHDGALSILKSFTPEELRHLALRAGLEQVAVIRQFPYRLVLSGRRNRGEIGVAQPDYDAERQPVKQTA
jgi:ubiquinone/menaquinone biosynthesis C-methylase UbiE